jgi:hypothetical protein
MLAEGAATVVVEAPLVSEMRSFSRERESPT